MADTPELTAQELEFVELLAIDGKSQAEAYLQAYQAHGYARNSLYVAASREAAKPHVQAAIAQLRADGLAKATLRAGTSLEQRLAEEYTFLAECKTAGSWGAAGAAQDRINKLLGLYVERTEHSFKDADPERTLEEISKISPELARSLAEKHNIPWKEPESVIRH